MLIINDYVLAEIKGKANPASEINEYLKAGYILHGTPFYMEDNYNCLVQAMILWSEDEQNEEEQSGSSALAEELLEINSKIEKAKRCHRKYTLEADASYNTICTLEMHRDETLHQLREIKTKNLPSMMDLQIIKEENE